jgi:hypothetical protein
LAAIRRAIVNHYNSRWLPSLTFDCPYRPSNATTFVKDGHNYRDSSSGAALTTFTDLTNIPKMDNPKGNGKPGSYSINLLQIEKTAEKI